MPYQLLSALNPQPERKAVANKREKYTMKTTMYMCTIHIAWFSFENEFYTWIFTEYQFFLLRKNSAFGPPGLQIGMCVPSIAPRTPGKWPYANNCCWILRTSSCLVGNWIYRFFYPAMHSDTDKMIASVGWDRLASSPCIIWKFPTGRREKQS